MSITDGQTSARPVRRRARAVLALTAASALAVSVSACGSSSKTATASTGTGTGSSSANWSTATSAAGGGGMSALVAAAKKEGQLNVITLPANWANYGVMMAKFKAEYGINITDANPDGSSAQEIQAIQQLKGRSSAPDVVDVGQAFAVQDSSLFAPYEVQTWNDVPADAKDASGHWYSDYGGYVSFGCNMKLVKTCPTTWAALTESQYKKSITLNGVPGQANAATSAVWAAAINNGGSFTDAKPGLTFFSKLKSDGNFNSTDCDSATTVEAGQCPILINWDFLNVAGALKLPATMNWKVVVPNGQSFASYYAQAISATAPHPAAARLWEEFLYSNEGQNIFLQGYARPIRLAAMVKAGTVDKAAYAKLPTVHNVAQLPTSAQAAAAAAVIAKGWGS